MTRDRQLIVALDVPERTEVIRLGRLLAPHVAMLKVGLEAFVAFGPDLVRELLAEGAEVFLDLKLHDIPRTAGAAARSLRGLGVRLLTVHVAGGPAMVRAVRDSLPDSTHVIAVTVLTSLDDHEVRRLGFGDSARTMAMTLGELALAEGADGLVSSAHELAVLAHLGGLRVVPGIRPQMLSGASAKPQNDDQRRVATPREAIRAGASWIVVGRPVVAAPDPVAAVRAINDEILGARS